MNKPMYTKWKSLAIVLAAIGMIGLSAGCSDPGEQAVPTATAGAEPTALAPTSVPPSEASPDPASATWESAIKQIAGTDTPPAQKADAIEVMAKSYNPSAEELKDFESQIVEEYTAGNYLAHPEDAEYMLVNLFKAAVIIQKHPENEAIRTFAADFSKNSRLVFSGEDTADSAAVQSNHTRMDQTLEQLRGK
ncbi:hypothetical protein [Paenibacillus piscarius]|uniref:hypothetical protein n=1 Tax=Paenibacillus piscarius TaxID=1089681 RepID=UPI001EE87198|nr:hypothetical protein [Paenibacillus piscarius]